MKECTDLGFISSQLMHKQEDVHFLTSQVSPLWVKGAQEGDVVEENPQKTCLDKIYGHSFIDYSQKEH